MEIITRGGKETQQFGERIAKKLKGGEVIGLVGELGSGKTIFVKGLAKGLGIKELITSPSFVLIREYSTPTHLRLVHIDLYRLKKLKEIKELGLLEYLGKPNKICIIEWAEKIKNILDKIPAKSIWVEFEHEGGNVRMLKLKW